MPSGQNPLVGESGRLASLIRPGLWPKSPNEEPERPPGNPPGNLPQTLPRARKAPPNFLHSVERRVAPAGRRYPHRCALRV